MQWLRDPPEPTSPLAMAHRFAEPAPYCAAAVQALHAWSFCGGWHPERLPLYAALFGVDDPEMIAGLMIALRGAVNGN